MTLERCLLAAQGYLELGMPEEALAELGRLSHDVQIHVDTLLLRLLILMSTRRWRESVEVCETLRRVAPECPAGFFHGAFCLHELGRTSEAKALLMAGPSELANEATYHYNLGCYEAVLGNLDEAVAHIHTSFAMDKKFRDIARIDPDLKSVTHLI